MDDTGLAELRIPLATSPDSGGERRRLLGADLAASPNRLEPERTALARLHELSMSLAAPLEVPDALRSVLATLVELHGAERGVLWLYEPLTQVLRAGASLGCETSPIHLLSGSLPDRELGATATAFSTRRRAVAEDLGAETAQRLGMRAEHSTPILARSGDVLGVLSVHFDEPRAPSALEVQVADLCARHAADVLETSRARRELDESEQRFRDLADAAPAMLWTTDAEGYCTFLSRGWHEFTGQTEGASLGTGWCESLHPEDTQAVCVAFAAAIAARVPITLEYRIRRWDGVYRWVIDRGRPRFDERARLVGFIGSVIDITERKLAEDALKDADRRKDEFLATLAHELRNPLSPIRHGLQLMRLAGDDRKRVEDAREVMERQLQHMVRLIDDLLDVSRISRGKIELRRQRVDLATVVLSAVETTRPTIEQLGHDLALELPRSPVYVDADVTRLGQVFANLLHNAAKYTNPGGHIRLAAESEDGGAAISVSDDGLGIPPEMLDRVFDPFTQVDGSLERSRGGLGLGLTIVKRLVEMHGGWVEARSEGQGRGCVFVVHLPAVASGARISAPRREEPFGPTRRRRVLVVDDNRDSADSLAMLLQVLGHEVEIAYDGEEALETAAKLLPEVVLLDIGMPKLSGYEVCERMRHQPWARDAVIVAVTGWGQQEDKRRSHEAGFDHHLVKPIDPSVLREVLSPRD
jgi:PAS domain S-box-containing protein